MDMTGSFHGSSSLCSLIDVGRLGQVLREWGAVGCQHSSPSFRPGTSPLAPDSTEYESRLPVGRQLAGPFPSYHKVPPKSVATSHKAIHYLAVPLEGCWCWPRRAESHPRQSIVRGKKAEASLLGSCPVRPRPRPGSVRAAACRGITNHRTGAGRPCDGDGHTDGSEGRRG